jgi:5-methylcytosine-specific restriction endonuclease McrA
MIKFDYGTRGWMISNGADSTAAERAVATICSACAVSFAYERQGRGRPRKYCSDCVALEAKRAKFSMPCATCGTDFRPNLSGAQRFCSMSCRPPQGVVYPSVKERRCAAADRRRTQKFGAGYERFMRKEIYERDGWTCQICMLPVDRSEKPSRHLRPSLDHVTPLAKGGAHSRLNVQCAHWICNSRKAHLLDGGMRAAQAMESEHGTRRV